MQTQDKAKTCCWRGSRRTRQKTSLFYFIFNILNFRTCNLLILAFFFCVFIHYHFTAFLFFKQYFWCLSYPSPLPTHSQTIFIKISILSLIWSPPSFFFTLILFCFHTSAKWTIMAQQKITLDQIKSIVVRAIGSFYIVSRNNKAFFIITLIYIYIYIYIYM